MNKKGAEGHKTRISSFVLKVPCPIFRAVLCRLTRCYSFFLLFLWCVFHCCTAIVLYNISNRKTVRGKANDSPSRWPLERLNSTSHPPGHRPARTPAISHGEYRYCILVLNIEYWMLHTRYWILNIECYKGISHIENWAFSMACWTLSSAHDIFND